MKKILFLFIITISMFALSGCNSNDQSKSLDTEEIQEEPVDYKIDKIILSKGYQSIIPNVEVIKKGTHLKLLASPGLLESSGVTIDKVTKSGKKFNIYIKNLTDEESKQLSTPQILLEINDPMIKKSEGLHFNIINQNYKPIPLKLDKNQILNKIYADFKIKPTSAPSVELLKIKDSFVWNISFNSVLNTEDVKPSLVNLNVTINANTGKIIDVARNEIGYYIDVGSLLDYNSGKTLLYKQQHVEKDYEYDSLWLYDIETGKRNNIYTSRNSISSALFSPDGKHISFIETHKDETQIFVASKVDNTSYGITSIAHPQPKSMKWANNNSLYFTNIDDSGTTFFEYTVNNGKWARKLYTGKIVESFDINKGQILLTEYDEDRINRNIYLTKNGVDLTNVGSGFHAIFLNDRSIAYLKNIEKEDKNLLYIDGMDGDAQYKDSEYSISNYFQQDNNNIILTKKNTCNSDYLLARYNIAEKTSSPIANVNSDRIFYNNLKNTVYVNISQPSDKGKQTDKKEHNTIYSVDINKLNIDK